MNEAKLPKEQSAVAPLAVYPVSQPTVHDAESIGFLGGRKFENPPGHIRHGLGPNNLCALPERSSEVSALPTSHSPGGGR